jgi:heptosyltransferase II
MAHRLEEARRILVVTKFRYLGDTIVATPFFRRLHEALPDAEVTLLTGPSLPVLLKGCPYLREVWPFDPKSGGFLRRNRQLVAQIRGGRFDAVFLLNRSLHSALVARAACIPERIGFDTEYRGPLLTERVPYDWGKPDRDCALDLLRAVGIPAEPALPELWVSEEERDEARRLLEQHGVSVGSFIVGMQPGANDPTVREWGAERFTEVASRLQAERGAQVVLLGSGDERAVSERVAALMARKPVILTGVTGLRQALAVISQCSLWVGNDGGLLHAAVALGPATVGIFGPTKAPRWGYDTPRHRTMVVYPDSPAGDPQTIRRCLDAITPESVLDAVEGVLKEERT